MLAVGEVAPEFEAATADGRRLRLSELRGRTVVLYFFPKAGTLGCARESRELARRFPELSRVGAEIVGVSVDSVEDLREFAVDCSLPFPLVSDSDKSIARRYGVLGAFGVAKRVTFLVGVDGRIIQVIDSLLPAAHAGRAATRLLAAEPEPEARARPTTDVESKD